VQISINIQARKVLKKKPQKEINKNIIQERTVKYPYRAFIRINICKDPVHKEPKHEHIKQGNQEEESKNQVQYQALGKIGGSCPLLPKVY
jgi:hypothetical protein